jgi:hypothetical protein
MQRCDGDIALLYGSYISIAIGILAFLTAY